MNLIFAVRNLVKRVRNIEKQLKHFSYITDIGINMPYYIEAQKNLEHKKKEEARLSELRAKPISAYKKCRPPEGATEVLRLTNEGIWVEDDGELGAAFSGKYEDTSFAWYGEQCWDIPATPSELASKKTCDRYQCANGRVTDEEGNICEPRCV